MRDSITINKYGQGLIDISSFVVEFNSLDIAQKRNCLNWLLALIQQSKPVHDDIEPAITESGLKPTYTPCVLLRKGVEQYRLTPIVALPEYELEKALRLLMSLFKQAYQRRFQAEKNVPHKWWYWDMSDSSKMKAIEAMEESRSLY